MADDKDFQELSLDTTLDDIDDLPSFSVFPTGAYMVQMEEGMVNKIEDMKAISVPLTLLEVVEVDKKALDKEEELPKEGDIASLFFKIDNPIGAGKLKQFASPIGASAGETSLRGIIETSRGMVLLVTLTRTWNKEKQRYYQDFSNVAVP